MQRSRSSSICSTTSERVKLLDFDSIPDMNDVVRKLKASQDRKHFGQLGSSLLTGQVPSLMPLAIKKERMESPVKSVVNNPVVDMSQDERLKYKLPPPVFPKIDAYFSAVVFGADNECFFYTWMKSEWEVKQALYLELAKRLQEDYRRNGRWRLCSYDFVEEGMLVIAKTESTDAIGFNENYFRAKVVKKNEDGQTVVVARVDDFPQEVTVQKEHVFLPSVYTIELPGRAIKCEVKDLGIFHGLSFVSEAVQRLNLTNKDLRGRLKWLLPHPTIELETKEGGNVLDMIREEMRILCRFPRDILPAGAELKVKVTHVAEDGHIWARMDNNVLMEKNILSVFDGFDPKSLIAADRKYQDGLRQKLRERPTMVFGAPFEECYYRAKVVRYIDDKLVHMSFIDFGNSDNVLIDDIILIEEVDKNLHYIPPQAKQFKLKGIDYLDTDALWEYLESSNDQPELLIVTNEVGVDEIAECDIQVKLNDEMISLVSHLKKESVAKKLAIVDMKTISSPEPIEDKPYCEEEIEGPVDETDNSAAYNNPEVMEMESFENKDEIIATAASVASSEFNGSQALQLPPPDLPENEKFFVRLLGIDKSGVAMIQLISKDVWETYNFYMAKLKEFASSKGVVIPIDEIARQSIVIAKIDENYIRAEVLDINLEEGQVMVRNIDENYPALVSKDDVFYIPAKAMKMPARTIRCVITGLDLFEDTDIVQKAYALYTQLTADLDSYYLAKVIKRNGVPHVELTAILEERFADRIQKYIPFACDFLVPAEGETLMVTVVYVGPDGFIWYQSSHTNRLLAERVVDLSTVYNYQQTVEAQDPAVEVAKVKKLLNDPEMVFAAQDQEGTYYRAKVLAVLDDERVNVMFIDYGNQEDVEIDKMISLDSVDKNFRFIPPLAKRFRLANGRFDRDLVDSLISQADNEQFELVVTDDAGPEIFGDVSFVVGGEEKSLCALVAEAFGVN